MNKKILACITDGKKFLALKTAEHPEHGPSKWFTVTGSIEDDETPEEAVKREIKEETFLNVKEVFPLNWGSIYNWDNETCREMNFITFVSHGKIKLDVEHVNYEWIELKEFVKKIKWGLDKKELAKVLKAGLKKELFFKKPKMDDFRK